MFTRLYQQVPLINRLPPSAVALGVALLLMAAGIGAGGVISGQSSAEIRQTLTVANAETLSPISNTATALTTVVNIPGDNSISVAPSTGAFAMGNLISIDAGGINVELRKISTITGPATGTQVFVLDVPLSIAHGSGVPVVATVYARTPGIATENKTRFISAIALEQGEVGRISVALENNSNQKAVARIDIEGVPPGATVNATSLDITKITDVVRQGANSFLVATNEFTVGTPLNLAFDLIISDISPPGNFPLDIKVQQIPN